MHINKLTEVYPARRRSRRRGRFIMPTADLSALRDYRIILFISIITVAGFMFLYSGPIPRQ